MNFKDYDDQFLRNLGIEPITTQGEPDMSTTTISNPTVNSAALEVADVMLFDAIKQFIDNGATPDEVRQSVELTINDLGGN